MVFARGLCENAVVSHVFVAREELIIYPEETRAGFCHQISGNSYTLVLIEEQIVILKHSSIIADAAMEKKRSSPRMRAQGRMTERAYSA